jgi:hypothetical protein
MIAYLDGLLAYKEPTYVIIDVQGRRLLRFIYRFKPTQRYRVGASGSSCLPTTCFGKMLRYSSALP